MLNRKNKTFSHWRLEADVGSREIRGCENITFDFYVGFFFPSFVLNHLYQVINETQTEQATFFWLLYVMSLDIWPNYYLMLEWNWMDK